MKILIIYRYYWPDIAPYGKILKYMTERWVKDRNDVTVFTGQPTYNDINATKRPRSECHNGVKTLRAVLFPERKNWNLLRIINFALFLLQAVFHVLLKKNYQLIVVNSFPPVFMGTTARWISKIWKIPYIYHCQDLHPESARIGGGIKNRWLFETLKRIDTRNCIKAWRVVTLSKDMNKTLALRGLPPNNIRIINNFILDSNDGQKTLPAQMSGKTKDDFFVLFAGNMGHFQGLERIIEACRILSEYKQMRFFFMGEGSAKKNLMRQSGDLLNKTIFFIPYQPTAVAFRANEVSDFAIVALKPDVYRVAFPSKTMMYLAAGCPILALIEKESELAREILERDLGLVCSQTDAPQLADTIYGAWKGREIWRRKRKNISIVARQLFGKEMILKQWSDLIRELSTDTRSQEAVSVS